MYQDVKNFFQWAWDLMTKIPQLFTWLVTPIPALTELLGFSVSPLLLVGATAIIIGIIRAIIGSIVG